MAFNASDKGGGDFKKVPAGSHIAVCNLVADVGLQPTGYGPKHKAYVRFEIPGERIKWEKDGKEYEGPMSIGMFLTVSLSKKATMRGLLESWRGKAFTADELKGFDLFKLVGVPAMLSVIHQPDMQDPSKVYANIKSISGLPKGVEKPKPENPLLKYGPDDRGEKDKLPDWLKEKIDKQLADTPEDERVPETAGGNGPDPDDDIPF
jgi:hypothetical protein